MKIHSRHGQGTVIIIAALFILVMAVMQIAQSYLLSQVGDQTTRSSLGRQCAVIAESAIEEAHVLLADRLNTPSDPLFTKVRTDAPTKAPGTEFASLTLPLAELPRLTRLLATETGKNCDLLELSVSLQSGRPLAIGYALEYDGVIVYKARVRSKLDRGIIRELEESQAFKVNLIAMPAPLPRVPVIVRDCFRMLFGRRSSDPGQPAGQDANDLRKRIVEDHIPGVRRQYNTVMGRFNSSAAQRASFLQTVKPYYDAIAAPLAEVEKLGGETTVFPAHANGVAPYVLFGQVDGLQLAQINLQALFTKRLPRLDPVVREIDALANTIQSEYDNNDSSETARQHNQTYTTLMIEELAILADALKYIKDVQTNFKAFEQGANAATFPSLLLQLQSVDAVQLASPFNALAQRATHRITEEPGVTIQTQWERLRKRLDTFGGGFCGLVYVNNPTQQLTLSGEIAGNLVIAVAGKLLVENLKTKFDNDTLTIIARGGEVGGGAVGLSGVVGASISTRGTALDMRPGTEIVGTLLLDEIPLSLTDGLTGKVYANPKLADTGKPPFWYVSLSPWVRSRTTKRS